jgi:hypothetical protein
MQLTATWHRATKPDPMKKEVERIYVERILDLFGTVEAAYASKEQWHRMGEPIIHPWRSYNLIAFTEATAKLSPSERYNCNISLSFGVEKK